NSRQQLQYIRRGVRSGFAPHERCLSKPVFIRLSKVASTLLSLGHDRRNHARYEHLLDEHRHLHRQRAAKKGEAEHLRQRVEPEGRSVLRHACALDGPDTKYEKHHVGADVERRGKRIQKSSEWHDISLSGPESSRPT